jgi:hypothetical protein
MDEFFALLVGAVVVVFYSYRRFNRSTDETSRQLAGLVSLLTPDRLRSRQVVSRAYIFYVFTFLVIYLLLCVYAQFIPMLAGPKIPVGAVALPQAEEITTEKLTAGFTADMAAEDVTDMTLIRSTPNDTGPLEPSRSNNIGIAPATSLAVALLIVGLAPSFPLLEHFETWMRGAAHRLAGIPTRILAIRDDLRNQFLGVGLTAAWEKPENPLLIPSGYWGRMRHYRWNLVGNADASETFHEDIALIFAVSTWILERKLNLWNPEERERYSEIERDLSRRTEALVEALDERTGYDPASNSTLGPEGVGRVQGPPTKDGRPPKRNDVSPADSRMSLKLAPLANQTDALADDMCILLALYAEHEIIVAGQFSGRKHRSADESQPAVPAAIGATSQTTTEKQSGKPQATDASHQRKAAMYLLERFLDDYIDDTFITSRHRSYEMETALWAFFVIMAIAAAWSIWPGVWEAHLRQGFDVDKYRRLREYALTAFTAYCIPVFVALAIHDGSRLLAGSPNVSGSPWTRWLPQMVLIAVASWAVATVVAISSLVAISGIQFGWRYTFDNLSSNWLLLFEYNVPTTVRGVALALILVALIDSTLDRRPLSTLFSVGKALQAAFIMTIVGGVTALISTWVGSSFPGVQKREFNDVDYGLITYAAIYSAIISFFVVFAVAEMIVNNRRSKDHNTG